MFKSRHLLLVWALLAAWITLMPQEVGPLPPVSGSRFFGTERAVADFLLNVAFFLPFGIWIRLAGLKLGRGILIALLVTTGIEIAQLIIPGRFSHIEDLVANTCGAGLGYWLPALAAAGVRRTAAWVAWLAISALVALSAGRLYQYHFPHTTYYAQYTPTRDFFGEYDGSLIKAMVDSSRLRPWRIDSSDATRERLERGGELRLTLAVGSRPRQFSPLFAIFDERQSEVMIVGVSGDDLMFRFRTVGASVGFDNPLLRVSSAMTGYSRGDTVEISLTVGSSGSCVRVERRETCGVGNGLHSGWGLFLAGLGQGREWLASVLWIILLTIPLGFFAPSITAVAISALFVFALSASSIVPGTVPLRPDLSLAGVVSGHILGVVLAILVLRSRAVDSGALDDSQE